MCAVHHLHNADSFKGRADYYITYSRKIRKYPLFILYFPWTNHFLQCCMITNTNETDVKVHTSNKVLWCDSNVKTFRIYYLETVKLNSHFCETFVKTYLHCCRTATRHSETSEMLLCLILKNGRVSGRNTSLEISTKFQMNTTKDLV